MPRQSRRILPLIAVAAVSAAAGGWAVITAFDSRAQVVAATLAAAVSRHVAPTINPSGRAPRPNIDRQFRA